MDNVVITDAGETDITKVRDQTVDFGEKVVLKSLSEGVDRFMIYISLQVGIVEGRTIRGRKRR